MPDTITPCKEIPLSQGKVALVDTEDYERVTQHKWHAHYDRNWYALTNVILPSGRRTTLYLHRFILSAKKGQMIDHRDGDGLNNRRSNLRLAAHFPNGINRPKPVNNKSGFKGVFWFKSKGRGSGYWRAVVKVKGRAIHLGLFNDPVDAARAYDAAASREFGEFAHLNFPAIRSGEI